MSEKTLLLLKDVALPHPAQELGSRKHLNAVQLSGMTVERHDDKPCVGEVFTECTQTFGVLGLYLLTTLELDSHTSVTDNGIHFVATRCN